MSVRTAEASWEGPLSTGKGTMKLAGGLLEAPFTFGSRMENRRGSNPEELIGAAHAGCFSMALSAGLSKAGHTPQRIHTTAQVHLDKVNDGFKITRVRLRTEATVPGIDAEAFHQQAEHAKANCPVSKALAGTEIELEAHLVS